MQEEINTINDKSYAREKLHGFHGFSMNHISKTKAWRIIKKVVCIA